MDERLYRLLPLDWKESKCNTTGLPRYDASTVFCDLHIVPVADWDQPDDSDGNTPTTGRYHFDWCVDEYYDEGQETYDSPHDAKASAEAWYLARIMPAVSPAQGASE